jgi:hypothetical protein
MFPGSLSFEKGPRETEQRVLTQEPVAWPGVGFHFPISLLPKEDRFKARQSAKAKS